MLGRSGRLGVVEELAAAPHELPVCIDLSFAPQVADQIEVKGRAVLPAEGLEAHSERHVHRPTDLLVEEDVAGETVDFVVEAERDLADAACALVELEQRP